MKTAMNEAMEIHPHVHRLPTTKPDVPSEGVRQLTSRVAEVVEGSAGAARVTLVAGGPPARRAVACLVAPRVGDLVLVAESGDRRWVLSVLERDERDVTLVAEGALTLKPAGRVTMASEVGVDVVTGGEVSVAAKGLEVNAAEAQVAVQHTSFIGRTLRSEVERVKRFAVTCDTVFERLSTRVKRAYRTVDETDQLRAGRIDHAADKDMTLRGRNLVATAKKLVKVDGDQIHLG